MHVVGVRCARLVGEGRDTVRKDPDDGELPPPAADWLARGHELEPALRLCGRDVLGQQLIRAHHAAHRDVHDRLDILARARGCVAPDIAPVRLAG